MNLGILFSQSTIARFLISTQSFSRDIATIYYIFFVWAIGKEIAQIFGCILIGRLCYIYMQQYYYVISV